MSSIRVSKEKGCGFLEEKKRLEATQTTKKELG